MKVPALLAAVCLAGSAYVSAEVAGSLPIEAAPAVADQGSASMDAGREAPDDDAHVDDRIESLEQSLMALNAELMILEEDLLYPASSRVVVYLSMDMGELFALDAVTLKLNGKKVTHHLYTERQRRALARGGVQELWVGNARQGDNELTAFFSGGGPHGRDYKRGTTVNFTQSFAPVFVELVIDDSSASQQPEFAASVY